MTDRLLPTSASPLEQAIAQACAFVIPLPIQDLWNPATCPATLLPYLAQALSVDFWDNAWPEATKRRVIADSLAWHEIKGTPAALERVFASLGYEIELTEWFQKTPTGTPGTFEVMVDLNGQAESEWPGAKFLHYVNLAKNKRSHCSRVLVSNSTTGSLFFSAFPEYLLTYDVLPPPTIYPEVEAGAFMAASIDYDFDYTINPT